jgi:hypothetical protein
VTTLTNKIAPRSRVFLENPKVPSPRNFRLWRHKFNNRFRRNPSSIHILRQIKPVHTLILLSPKIHFNKSAHLRLGLARNLLLSIFPKKLIYRILVGKAPCVLNVGSRCITLRSPYPRKGSSGTYWIGVSVCLRATCEQEKNILSPVGDQIPVIKPISSHFPDCPGIQIIPIRFATFVSVSRDVTW